jgi:hypothetical protein
MAEMIIRSEADNIDNAKKQLQLLIPEALYLVSTRVVSEGIPITTAKRDITVDADSLAAAREMINAQTPAGFQVIHEVIVSQGGPRTISAEGYTEDSAFHHAEKKVPEGSVVTDKTVIVPPEIKTVLVMAFDDVTARSMALTHFSGGPKVFRIRTLSRGRKGFLGVGRQPNQYSVDVSIQKASIEIKYLARARVRATVGEIVKPKAVLEATLVDGVDDLLDVMSAIAKSSDGLWDFTPGNWSDRYDVLATLEGLHDSRIPGVLVDYVKRHITDMRSRYDTKDETKCDAVNRVLRSLERIGGTSVRGDLIELIFDNLAYSRHLYVPDLFGRFTELFRALAKAFTPIVLSETHGWRDNDGYESWVTYDTAPLECAVESLCAVDSPVSSNLLHKLASLPSIQVPRGYSDKGDPGTVDPTESMNLRQRAGNEIVRRSRPPHGVYDFEAYQINEYYH